MPSLPPGGLDLAFLDEERRGLRLAALGRLLAVLAVAIWLLVAIPEFYTLPYHAVILAYLALGLIQLRLLFGPRHRRWHAYLFAALDGLLLALVLLAPNPLLSEQPPPAMALRYANVIFFFVFLAGAALAYSPLLVLWTGLTSMLAWGTGVWMIAHAPGTITNLDPLFQQAASLDEKLELYMRPDFLHVSVQVKKVFVVLLVATLLAVAAARARRLVRRQVLAERARTNLARYFSPNLVEELASKSQPLGEVRRQAVAILFADIKGFTRMCEALEPEAVVAFLRSYHRRIEAAVFDQGGTLDKYIGDGVLATFGTPTTGPDDASRALACGRRLLAEIDALNQERHAEGLDPIAIAIGIHYGPVVQGDIGGGDYLEFTVLGDAVNVAARLEQLTRELDTDLALSGELVQRVREESAGADLDDLQPEPPRTLRGRTLPTVVYARRKKSGSAHAPAGNASPDSGS